MKSFTLLTAAVAAAATLATAASAPMVGAAVRTAAPPPQPAAARSVAEQLRSNRQAVVYFMQKTWNVQDRIPVPHTPTNHAERHWRSPAALHWLKHRWNVRWHRAKHRLASLRLPRTNDWATAVRLVQRSWSGTSNWLLSCSSGEGGHGAWVWNGPGHGIPFTGSLTPPAGSSGAGGWMQFMRSTFNGKYAAALQEARQRHLARPRWVKVAWLSPVAQAFAAGWARFHGATGAWDPGIDPACA